MLGINSVTLMGNLGKDPECRYTPNGTAVATLALATNEVWKDKDGEKQERTEWHRVILWGVLAEIVSKHTTKGSGILIVGKLTNRSWDDKDDPDKKHFITEVVARELRIVSGYVKTEGQDAAARDAEASASITDDDIPF